MPDLGPLLRDVIEGSLSPLDLDAIVADRRRQRRRRRINISVAVAAVVVIVGGAALALGSESRHRTVGVNVSPTSTPSTVAPKPAEPQHFQIDARVESDAHHRPELCLYPTATDTGFDCAGPPVTNWDWNTAPDPQRASGETYGEYHVVGTYNGHAFTLTHAPTPGHTVVAPTPSLPAPCPTPPGGWRTTNNTRLALSNFQSLQSVAQGAPDYAGTWISSTTSSGPGGFQNGAVTVIAFTGDLARHRQDLAAVWGGPVCVVQHPHSYNQLQVISHAILDAVDRKELDIQIISVGPYEVDDTVHLQVIAATPATQHALDERYGAGLVTVSSLMKPIP